MDAPLAGNLYRRSFRGAQCDASKWVVDSEFRFFPPCETVFFDYVFHSVDLATNKVMAAAGRREVRFIS
jgi:hypothetical protein